MKLQALGVGFDYGTRRVLEAVDLAVGPGEVLALLGPNGVGKSTLLRCLLGLLKPTRGRVELGGRQLEHIPRRELARRLAYVPQAHAAPFPYTVRQVVALGRLPHGGPWASLSARDQRCVTELLTRLRIAHLAERPYTEVSGGERQLTLIARALAQEARMLVMDEPATGLDYGNQWRLLQLVRELADEGLAFVISTHTPEHALYAATRGALLHGGGLVAVGPPAEVITPAHIATLYGFDVVAQASPCGDPRRVAFFPAEAGDSRARGPQGHPS